MAEKINQTQAQKPGHPTPGAEEGFYSARELRLQCPYVRFDFEFIPDLLHRQGMDSLLGKRAEKIDALRDL